MDVFIKEIALPAIPAGEQRILSFNGIKLSESSLKKFIPVLGIAVLNLSSENIKVFVNESPDNCMRLSGSSSRTLTGVPAWDITVQNLGVSPIADKGVVVTLFNDLEQVSRYNAYAKMRGY
jgi:hypothetical protein